MSAGHLAFKLNGTAPKPVIELHRIPTPRPPGMPRFTGHVSPAETERIRAYVARQAAMLFEDEQAAGVEAAAVRRASPK